MTRRSAHRLSPLVARSLAAVVCVASLAGCGVEHKAITPSVGLSAEHLKVFTDNDIPTEDPGGPGEVRALAYAKNYFASLGLKTFLQPVSLVRMVPTTSKVTLHGPKGLTIDVNSNGDNFIMWPGGQSARVQFDTSVVFAGFGIVSPEYQRDDYKDVDVTGKLVILLAGPPMTGDRDDLGTLGDTYYGTETYKYKEAGRHGAAGVLIIPRDDAEWLDIQATTTGSVIELDRAAVFGHSDPAPTVEGWLARPAATRLFGVAGLDFAKETTQAHEAAF